MYFSESSEDKDKKLAKDLQKRKPIRVVLHSGQTLIMDGYLVHCGDRGYMDEEGNIVPAIRLHMYLVNKSELSQWDEGEGHPEYTEEGYLATFPLTQVGKDLCTDLVSRCFLVVHKPVTDRALMLHSILDKSTLENINDLDSHSVYKKNAV